MIPKNLKVGDTFKDGDYTYVVKQIVKEGYISQRADIKLTKEDVIQPVEVEEITNESVTYSKTQVNRMPNSKLEEVCKELGIEVGTGTEMKRAIIAKLGL